jgi:hypothetical protein
MITKAVISVCFSYQPFISLKKMTQKLEFCTASNSTSKNVSENLSNQNKLF